MRNFHLKVNRFSANRKRARVTIFPKSNLWLWVQDKQGTLEKLKTSYVYTLIILCKCKAQVISVCSCYIKEPEHSPVY